MIAVVTLAATAALLLALGIGRGSGSHAAGADKVGGLPGPLVLRLAVSDNANQPESRLASYFAAQVAKLSHGDLQVQVTFEAAGSNSPNVEVRTVGLVRDGRFDLGWIGARAWDRLGVTSFRALQAPFLISNYALLDRVVKAPLAQKMLDGLGREHVVGLALIPGLLRHPAGVRRPLVALPDFAGARVRDQPSEASDALLQALGATPVHVGNASVGREIAAGRLDGSEISLLNAPPGSIVTANVSLFPKTMTLFAAERPFAALDEAQRHVLRAAANQTLHHNADFPIREALAFEGVLARRYCRGPGRVALATESELTVLRRAARPVYAMLDRDPQTRSFIAEIRRTKASLPPPPQIVVPGSCRGQTRLPRVPAASASTLNGTYHRRLTAAGARAVGEASGSKDQYPLVLTAVLRDGTWIDGSSEPPSVGTYTVAGNEIVLDLDGDVMRFTYTRDSDGTLHLRPVLPMDRGDQWVMAGAPWQRVGPPRSSLP